MSDAIFDETLTPPSSAQSAESTSPKVEAMCVGTPPYKLAHGAITAKFIYINAKKNDGSALFAAQLAPSANYYLYFALFCAIIIYILSV